MRKVRKAREEINARRKMISPSTRPALGSDNNKWLDVLMATKD